MPVSDPSDIQTQSRSEMVCPNCFTQGLEVHPGYESEYSGKAEIINATRCPNPECVNHTGKGVPSQAIAEQYYEPTLFERTSLSSVITTLGIFAIVGLLLIYILGPAFPLYGALPFTSTTSTITGSVETTTQSSIDASIRISGTDIHTETNNEGSFTLQEVPNGNQRILIEPESSTLASTSRRVSATGGQYDLGTIEVGELREISTTRVVGTEEIVVNTSHPENADSGIQLVFEQLPSESVTGTTTFSEQGSQTVPIPGTLIEEEFRVYGPVQTQSNTVSEIYTGDSIDLPNTQSSVQGMTVTINDSSAQSRLSRSLTVSSGDIAPTPFEKDAIEEPLQLTLSNGNATATQTTRDVYTGTNPSVSIAEQTGETPVTVTVFGNQSTTTNTTTGTFSGTSVSFTEPTSTSSIQSTTLSLTDVTRMSGEVLSTTVSADGSTDTSKQYSEPTTIESDGTYKLSISETSVSNQDLVSYGYTVNNDIVTVSDSQTIIELSEGDSFQTWIQADQENIAQQKTDAGFTDVEIRDTRVSSDSISTNEDITITATATYTGSGSINFPLKLYKDGREQSSRTQRIDISENSEKQVQFSGISFSESGVHTVSINDGQQIKITVGDGTVRSGSGSIQVTLSQAPQQPSVTIDTTGDGTEDCELTQENTCSITPETLSQPHAITLNGVSTATYELSYESTSIQKDVSVDIDDDGINEIDQSGVLEDGAQLSNTTLLPQGRTELDFSSSSDSAVPYEITYEQANVIDKPKILADGELIIEESTVVPDSRTYSVPAADEYQIQTEQPQSVTVTYEWYPSSGATYPPVQLNGQTVCESTDFTDNTCSVSQSALTSISGPYTLSFETTDDVDFSTDYQIGEAPPVVTLTGAIGQTTIQTEITRGQWKGTSQSDILSPSNTDIEISTNPPVRNSSTEVTYEYRPEPAINPLIEYPTDSGTNTISIVEEGDLPTSQVTREVQVVISQDEIPFGTLPIRIRSENTGAVKVTATTTGGPDDTITINDTD